MSAESQRAVQMTFLRSYGAEELGHSSEDLLSHLEGTRELLAAREASERLCTAGLFHSVYGTESYAGTLLPLDLRPRVQALIGIDTEHLAYLFGAMTKASFYSNLERVGSYSLHDRFSGQRIDISPATFCDLSNLTVANWLEQRPRVAHEKRDIRREEFRKMRPHLLPLAKRALDAAYGFIQEIFVLSHR